MSSATGAGPSVEWPPSARAGPGRGRPAGRTRRRGRGALGARAAFHQRPTGRGDPARQPGPFYLAGIRLSQLARLELKVFTASSGHPSWRQTLAARPADQASLKVDSGALTCLQLTALAGRLGSLGGGPEVHAGTGAADGPGGGQPSPARGVRAHGPRPASHHDRDRGAAAPCTASSIGLNGSNIETVSAGLEDVAFLNPDGTKVLVTNNNSNAPISFAVQSDGRYFTYTIPAQAMTTFFLP